MRHSSSQLTLQGAGCDRQWIVWDGVGPTVRTGQLLCRSRLQQMLVQMPWTSVSLTTLIAATLRGSRMALGQRSGNSMAANAPYTCLNLHNVVEWITDKLVCCRTMSPIQCKRLHTCCRSKNRMSCKIFCLNCKFKRNAMLNVDTLHCTGLLRQIETVLCWLFLSLKNRDRAFSIADPRLWNCLPEAIGLS